MITGQSQTSLDPAWLDDFVGRWEEGWNSHDPHRLLALMTEDIVYDDSAWPTTMRGHADVRRFLDSAWTAMPDLRFEMIDGPYIRPGRPEADRPLIWLEGWCPRAARDHSSAVLRSRSEPG